MGPSHDPLEQEAERVSRDASAAGSRAQIHRAPAQLQRSGRNGVGMSGVAPRSVREVLAGEGSAMPAGVQAEMSTRFGHDFSRVRIHTGHRAEQSARDVTAKAYTVGDHIVFGAGHYSPESQPGKQLLAHELTHVVQQSGGSPYVARSVDDWLAGSVNIGAMSYTQLLGEADELRQYLDRQTSSSPDTLRIQEALSLVGTEINRREAAAAGPRTRGRGRTRAAPVAEAPLPARYPRVLLERTSVAYADAEEMRAEYDLIMEWLARRDISAEERRILTAGRESLAPQLRSDRERVVAERHAARVRLALTPADQDEAHALETLSRTIQGIAPEAGNPDIFYIYHQGERVPISRDQAAQLRVGLRRELRRAAQTIELRASYYWDRYNSQLAINRESPIVAGISGWLAGVEDPGDELRTRYFWVYHRIRRIREHLEGDRLVEAAALLPQVDFVGQEIRQLSRAFYEGLIEGAGTAVTILEITRDVSFAVAASIGAVVAAPFVAGVVAGAGVTGTAATALTIVGTGTVVGSGTGLVRGGSAALGVGVSGGSADAALAAFRSEGTRGFVDGFVAGAGGSAARALAPALVGRLGSQLAARVATNMIVNSGATVIDSLANGATIGQAAQAGVTAAILSIPGGLVGDSRLGRQLLGPMINSATAYAGAIANGASPDQARRAAIVALSTALATGAILSGRTGDDAYYEQRGREVGRSVRSTVASTSAAVMIGVAEAVPPVRTVGGATTTTTISQPLERPAVTISAPAATTAPVSVQAQTQTTAATTAPAPVSTQTTAVTPVQTAAPLTSTAVGAAATVNAATFATSVAPAVAAPPPTTTVAPNVEAEMGMGAAQRAAAARSFSGTLTSADNAALGNVWNQVANPGEAATLTAANSRRLFNNQRNRFWRAVRRDPAALQVIRNMGGTFPEERNGGTLNPNATSIPEINLPNGTRLRISIDHVIERQTAPNLALNPNNLRLSTVLENTVLLRQLHDQDPFINPPPGWTPGP